jgi:hypothetical protein
VRTIEFEAELTIDLQAILLNPVQTKPRLLAEGFYSLLARIA